MSRANPNQAGMVRAQGRKRANRALREEHLRGEAMQLGIPFAEHKRNLFGEVQFLRKHPPIQEAPRSRNRERVVYY